MNCPGIALIYSLLQGAFFCAPYGNLVCTHDNAERQELKEVFGPE